uniref:Uncharacterized protein n=1 Tax=Anguilla anguilla TaxID=7936 RepID=A0A0E9V9Q9_ANGAN
MLLMSLEQQTGMREALKNFEGKSRRTIMRIYNVPEDAEEDSFVLEFVDKLKCKTLPTGRHRPTNPASSQSILSF